MSSLFRAVFTRLLKLAAATVRVAAVSCITNLASSRYRAPLSHGEVLETAKRVETLATQLLKNFARIYGQKH